MLVPTITLHPTNRSSEKKLFHDYRKTDRRNSSKSTGPKTREGKFKSSLNALRHGTYCETHHSGPPFGAVHAHAWVSP